MARTIEDSSQLRMSFPIVKIQDADDGNLFVFGKATDATVDSDDQIVDGDWSAKALEEWLKTGANVRVQHSPFLYPAGKGVEVATSPDGHYVKALVVEETAKRLVSAGVLQAFSVGISSPKVIKDLVAKNGRIVGGSLAEISLVDRPANANCGVKIVKSVDGAPVDAEELFGNLEEALLRAEGDLNITVVTKSEDDDLSSELLAEWATARDTFVNNTPVDKEDTAAWDVWKAEKDLFYAGTAESRSTWLYKRDMDAGVGGGTDRDKIPAGDFAGPNRTYPIVTPKDVHDAASLVGHADNPDQVKRRIIAIAHRKGQAFVDQLPSSWTDGDGKTVEPDVEKAVKDCPKCGKTYHADSKQRTCEECGASLPVAADAEKSDDEAADKAGKPNPFAKKPAGDAADDDDGDEEDAPPAKKDEFPYTLKRLHDVSCAVYSDGAVLREYASLKSWNDAINVEKIREFYGDEVAEEAATLKDMEPERLADARAQLHKAFSDMYPNTSVSPTDMTPGKFSRGYLSAGHSRQTASGGGARIPSVNSIDADQFTRGPLTEGHERPSPAEKGGASQHPADFAAASAAFTANMLQSLHDHITDTRAEVCAFAETNTVMPPDMASDATLTPVTPPKWAQPEYIKELVDARVEAVMLEKSAYYEDRIAALQATVDEIGAQPDPAQAPVRGVVARSADSGKGTPVEKSSAVERREPSEDDRLRAYAQAQVNSGDPFTRKNAQATLDKLGPARSDD